MRAWKSLSALCLGATASVLTLPGCEQNLKPPKLVVIDDSGNESLAPIDVAQGAAVGDPGFQPGTPFPLTDTSSESCGRGWSWVETPELTHFNEAKIRADHPIDDPLRLGFAYKPSPGSRKLLLVLQGGNGCANEVLCDNTENRGAFGPAAKGYSDDKCPLEVMAEQTPVDPREGDIFADDPDNPFRDHHYVFLPYVSGDMWLGDNPDEVVFANDESDLATAPRHRFRGRENLNKLLARIVPSFTELDEVVVTGYSAGSIGASFNFPRIVETFKTRHPNARYRLLADSGFLLPTHAPSASSKLNGFPVCFQRRLRDLFRADRSAPVGCPACTSEEFSPAVAEYLFANYGGEDELVIVAGVADQVIKTTIGAGQNNCYYVDRAWYDPTSANPVRKYTNAVDFELAARRLGDMADSRASLFLIDDVPNPDHPGTLKGLLYNHVWLFWSDILLSVNPGGIRQPDSGGLTDPANDERSSLRAFLQDIFN